MKQKYIKIMLPVLLCVTSFRASAHDFEVDGIYYNITSSEDLTVVVTYRGSTFNDYSNEYTGQVSIPETVAYNGLTYSVTSIGKSAFEGCGGLTSVTIGNGVTSIGVYAFNRCTSLFFVTIPNSVTSIGSYAFWSCNGLTSITIPNSVTSIGEGAFFGCSGLTSVTIGNSVTRIGEDAFLGCSGLTSVTLHCNCKDIGRCFRGFKSIKEVIIGDEVTSIGDMVFSGCSSLTSVTIPNSMTSIGSYAFSGCSSLTSVTIPNSMTSIESNTFYGCKLLTSLTIGKNVTTIGSSAFYECFSLTSINIPDKVQSIGDKAFYHCSSLASLNIGTGITNIGWDVFANCPELKEVYCHAESVPITGSNAFEGSNPERAKLHVPNVSVQEYKSTTPWSKFGIIVGLSGGNGTEKCAKPTISYTAGKLTFSSETEETEFVYEITDQDIKKGYEAEVQLSVTYNISVYATKDGYVDSDVATATLCWIDVEPSTEGIDGGAANVRALPVLIQSHDGVLTIEGANEGTPISVYNASGQLVGTATATTGTTIVSTTLHGGNVGIVRIGDRAVKVAIK